MMSVLSATQIMLGIQQIKNVLSHNFCLLMPKKALSVNLEIIKIISSTSSVQQIISIRLVDVYL